jgi:hypothetical protein
MACLLPSRAQRAPVAGGTQLDLWPGEKMLSAADPSHGSRQNHPTLDGTRSALLPVAAGFRLSATQARGGRSVMSPASRCRCHQKNSMRASLREKVACPVGPMTIIQHKTCSQGLVDLSTISHGSTSEPVVSSCSASFLQERMGKVVSAGLFFLSSLPSR